MNYIQFKHRPEQQFAYQRKPKIQVLTKSGLLELMKLSSHPVQFEPKVIEDAKPNVRRYPSQVTLKEKYDQVESEQLDDDQEQEYVEFYNNGKFNPYILQNHPYPNMHQVKEPEQIPFSAYQSQGYTYRHYDRPLIKNANIQQTLIEQKKYSPFQLSGSNSVKHFSDLHKSYGPILRKLEKFT